MSSPKSKKKVAKKVYDESFKKMAIDLAKSKNSVPDAAKELRIEQDLIRRWTRLAKKASEEAAKKVKRVAVRPEAKLKKSNEQEHQFQEEERFEPERKRSYAKRRKPRDYSDSSFQPIIDNFLPSNRRAFKPELKKRIIEASATLKVGQSIFIPDSELSVATLRALLKDEMKTPFFKNKDIRIIASGDSEKKGSRIARYL